MRKNINKRLARAALVGAACLLCFAPCYAQERASKIDEYMQAAVERSHFSGTVMVARDGRVITRSYGMASIEHGVPNTPQTRFRIGSLTKQFTAMGVMMLQERGKLNVQDSICKYLPECPEAWQPITIHHLLTHSSGIPNFTYSLNNVEPVNFSSPLAHHMEHLRKATLEFTPGARFRYSNSGYILLGHIIEKASGEPYDAFLRKNIFEPLGMTNTGYEDKGSIIKRRAAGYSLRNDKLVSAPYVDMSMPYSAGALYSTAEDMYLWDQALYTEKLISRKSLNLMFTPFKGNYGYGWDITEQFGRRRIGHMGWIEGYASYILRFPDDKLTIIIMSNLDGALVNTMARDLAAIALGVQRSTVQQRKAIKVDPKIYDAYVGQYQLAPDFIVTVIKEEDKLMAQAQARAKIELFPESEIEFFVKEYDAQIMFVWDAKGQVTHSIISLNGRETQAKKIK